MAPLSPYNTDRVIVDYQQGSLVHHVEMRCADVSAISLIENSFGNLFTAIAPALCATTIVGCRAGNSGSPLTFPLPTGLVGLSYGSGVPSLEEGATFMNFVGRSTDGRKVRAAIFGYQGGLSGFRLTSTESTEVDAAVDVLNAEPSLWWAIGGLKAIWYPYANIGYNAYWQRNLRS